ncbi:hypothetical protein [Nitrosomonas communis]|nr:hypothetical protein [Nitrosomonas communis]MCO6428272.1 hypothetical protein [Nitrosomonas communis]
MNWAQNERLVDEGIGQFISGRNCGGLFAVAVLLTVLEDQVLGLAFYN